MYVIHYLSAYFEVTGSGRNVVLDSSMAHHDIANEPLLGRVRGERQEYDETEDDDREGEQGQGVDPDRGYGGNHASLARRETARYTAAITRSMKAPMAIAIMSGLPMAAMTT